MDHLDRVKKKVEELKAGTEAHLLSAHLVSLEDLWKSQTRRAAYAQVLDLIAAEQKKLLEDD